MGVKFGNLKNIIYLYVMCLPIKQSVVTEINQTFDNQPVCKHCDLYLMAEVEFDDGNIVRNKSLLHKGRIYCDECRKKIQKQKSKLRKQKYKKPLPPRFCCDCNIPIGKGVKRCDGCKRLQSRSYYTTKFGVSLEVELFYITKWISEGNDTTLKLSKKYNETFVKSRSNRWLTGKLKRLGIYTLDRNKSAWERDTKHREHRELNASKWGYKLLDNTTRNNAKLECLKCGTIQKYYNVSGRYGNCSVCDKKVKNKKIKISKKENPNYISPWVSKQYIVHANIETKFINLDNSVTFKNKTEFSDYLTNKGNSSNHWLMTYVNATDGVNMDIQLKIKDVAGKLSTHVKFIDEINKVKECSKCNTTKPFDSFDKSRSPFICDECYYIDAKIKYKQNKIKNPSKYLASKLSLYIKEYAKKGWAKNTTRKLIDYLGIDIDDYKNYIESLWETGMNWDNTNEWHIDHIIPRSWFNQSERNVKAALNWRNTRPEWKAKNLYKGWRFDSNTELHLITTEWLEEFNDVIDVDKILSLSFVMKQPGQMKLLKQIRNTY